MKPVRHRGRAVVTRVGSATGRAVVGLGIAGLLVIVTAAQGGSPAAAQPIAAKTASFAIDSPASTPPHNARLHAPQRRRPRPPRPHTPVPTTTAVPTITRPPITTVAPTTTSPPATAPPTAVAPIATVPPITTVAPTSTIAPAPQTLAVSAPLVYKNMTDLVIDGVQISNPTGDCIQLWGVQHVIIRNSKIGPCLNGVYTNGATDVSITNSYFTGTTKAIYANKSSAISVEGNTFVDAGRNFVQFNGVTGAGNRIVSNQGGNSLGKSVAEDLISLFQSSGTVDSPILVANNRLKNGGPSGSGSGIMAGDGGGSYQVIRDNILLNPGQAGIGVASGTDISVTGNQIYSEKLSWSNVGIYVYNQYASECDRIEVSGNVLDWTNRNGVKGGMWDAKNCGVVTGITDNNWMASLYPAIATGFTI